MKKLSSLILVVVLIATLFTGCLGSNDNATFVGKWNAAINMTELLNEKMASNPALGGQKFKDVSMVISFEFKDDDTYKMEFTDTAAKELVDTLKTQMKAIMISALEEQLAGTGVSVEEALAASGMDLEETLDESVNVESIKTTLAGSLNGEGQFIAKEGKLYLSDSVEYAPAEEKALLYQVKGEGISIVSVEGVDSSSSQVPYEQLLPMELTKAQ